MALFIPNNSLYAPARRYRDPFTELDRVFDAVLDNDARDLLHVPKVSIPRISDDGKFTTTISTRDYNPAELKVEVDGRDLIVRGEHSSSDEHGGSMHRRFEQRLRIPDAVDLQSVKCNYDENRHALQFIGQATVEAPKKNNSIPINFKNAPAVENKKA